MKNNHKTQRLVKVADSPYRNKSKNIYSIYRCECGTYALVTDSAFRNKNTCSCGCEKLNSLIKRHTRSDEFYSTPNKSKNKIQKLMWIMRWPHRNTSGRTTSLFRCECGHYSVVANNSFKRNDTISCGCEHSRVVSKMATTHGLSKSSEYRAWAGMIARCKTDDPHWRIHYKDKGITVCEEWLGRGGFEKFYEHIGSMPKAKMEVDRYPDNKAGYTYGNVRWATRKQQMDNRGVTIFATFNGETKPIARWSEISGIPTKVIDGRLRLGWDDERAIFEPVKKRKTNDSESI